MTREELYENLEFTETVVEQLEEIDERFHKIRRKPIQLGIGVHVTMSAILFCVAPLIVIYNQFFALDGGFPYVTLTNMMYFSGGTVVAYNLMVAGTNLYVVFSKKWLHRDEVGKLDLRRTGLTEKLRKATVVPAEYWSSRSLRLMQKYIINGRADTLKEALNLLEEELRHEQLSELLGIKKKR